MQAVVIFSDECAHWASAGLRPGYRHVFAAVPSENAVNICSVVNLTMDGLQINAVGGTPAEVAQHYRQLGLEAWLIEATPRKRQLLPMTMNSCVGLTKQLLGIRSWALTPWQLRQHLAKEHSSWTSTSPSPA